MSLVGRRGIAEQIRRQIRAGIRDGHIEAADRLPSSRELAARLAVSRTTVSAVYDQLIAEGLLESRRGVGVYVASGGSSHRPAQRAEPARMPQPQPCWDELVEPIDLSATRPELDLRAGLPSVADFPYPIWRSMTSRQLRAAAAKPGAYGEPAGTGELRAAVARHIAVSRGVHVTSDDVFITSGAQQAFDLVARTLLAPGDVVAVEDPGYPPPHMLFTSLRIRVVGVPVDADGIIVSAIPDEARLVYVTPSHQFPLGMTMSHARRVELLDWADRVDAVILEDDYDSEFRYAGRPLDTLHSIDNSWRVIYVGSLSKVLLPALRLGFMVAPPSLFPALRKAKLVTDWCTPTPTQAALAQFIDDGHLARHIRRMRRIYQDRHELLVARLDHDFAEWLERIPSYAGIHVSAYLRPGLPFTDAQIARRARQAGLGLSPAISKFAVATVPHRQGIMLGYGAIETAKISAAMACLRDCFTDEAGLPPAERAEPGPA